MTHSCWYIQYFGSFQAQQEGILLTHFRTRKTAELLAYIAYHPRPHPREALMELLWPEVDPAVGRNRLKQTLAQLRRELEPPGTPEGRVMVADRMNVGLNPEAITTDIAEFEQALQCATTTDDLVKKVDCMDHAMRVYQGELLPGYYQDWVVQQRQFQADAYWNTLRAVARDLEQAGTFDFAIRYARRALSHDPLQEDVHQDLMRLYARMGQPSAVLRQFRQLEHILAEQLGERPSDLSCSLLHRYQEEAAHVVKARVVSLLDPAPDCIPLPPPERLEAAAEPDVEPAILPCMDEPSVGGERSQRRAPAHWRRWRFSLLRSGSRELLRVAMVAGLLVLFISRNPWSIISMKLPSPAFAAEQDRIITACSRNNKAAICSLRPDGSDVRYLTDPNTNEFDAALSPDRTRIAFVSDRDGNNEIYIMNTDGSNVKRLTNNPARDRHPSWTADGARIAFVSDRDGSNMLYIMNADGTQTAPLIRIHTKGDRMDISGLYPGNAFR